MTDSKRRNEVLDGPRQRRRRMPAEKLAIVAETLAPGVTVCSVARRHGVAPRQLFRWRRLAKQGVLTATQKSDGVAPVAAERVLVDQPPEPQRELNQRLREFEIIRDALDVATNSKLTDSAVALTNEIRVPGTFATKADCQTLGEARRDLLPFDCDGDSEKQRHGRTSTADSAQPNSMAEVVVRRDPAPPAAFDHRLNSKPALDIGENAASHAPCFVCVERTGLDRPVLANANQVIGAAEELQPATELIEVKQSQRANAVSSDMKLIPHINAVSGRLRDVLENKENDYSVAVLSTIYISLWDFDESWYLNNNPDLKASIPSEAFPTGWHHFKSVGYFEGRMPVAPDVDEGWYLSAYPDVAAAIIGGAFSNARDHFIKAGYAEGRVPAEPAVEANWYAQRFMREDPARAIDEKSCVEHFAKVGYRNGAIPAPPK